MNDYSPQNNLDWLAFQYVTGAIAQGECDEFEQQMLRSQDCREAVARAVEIALAAEFACRSSECESEVGLSRSAARENGGRTMRRGRRWVWSAVAASVAFLIGWQASVWFLGRDLGNRGHDMAESEGQPSDFGVGGPALAMAWEQTRRTSTLADLDNEFAPLASPDAEDSDEDSDVPAVASDIEAPSWMLAAVAGMRAAPAEGPSPEDANSPPADAPAPSDTRDEG